MAISDADYATATGRGQETRASIPAARRVTYDDINRMLVIEFSNGMVLMVPPAAVEGLAEAAASALAEVELRAGGLSLYWPSLDVDISVPALPSGITGSRAWMETHR